MKLARRLTAALLCLSLLCTAAAVASGSSNPNLYFMAVNETMVETTPGNMPMVVGGVLYVPYTMLSIRDTGINLGVSAQYSTTRRTVLVSGGQRAVTFDLQSNTAYDLQDNAVNAQAMVRNSTVYLPLAWVCSYFGTIRYTTNYTPYGTLVRITNDAAILNDAAFIDAADNLLRQNRDRYLQAIQPQQPSPTPEPEPDSDPDPSAVATTPPPETGPDVYLALLYGDGALDAAQQLESLGLRGLFFFSPEQLREEDSLVRRLIAAGHGVGLDLSGSTLSECVRQAQEGGALLADIACSPAYLVRATQLDEGEYARLEESGWAVWRPTLSAPEGIGAGQLMEQLSTGYANFVELTCQARTAAVLRTLDQEGCRFYLATAVNF